MFCRLSVRLAFPATLLEMPHMFPDENPTAAYLRAVRCPGRPRVPAPTWEALYSGEWTHPNQEKTPYG